MFSLLLLPIAACGRSSGAPTRPAGSPGQTIVDNYARAAHTDFKVCDDFACLEHAAASGCQPARLFLAHHTIEGRPSFDDCFLRQRGRDAPCEVDVISDYSFDYWGGCRIYKETCPSIVEARRRVVEAQPAKCGPSEILYEAKNCRAPFRHRVVSFFGGK